MLISVLSILWSICSSKQTIFDVGLKSWVNNLDDRGPGHVYIFYPTVSDKKQRTTTEVDIQYLFNEVSITGYDLPVKAVLNSPVKSGKYPIIAYIHGTGGFSLDTHNLLTHLTSLGFVIVAADMPNYRVGKPVLASAVQSFMGEVLTGLSTGSPLEAKEICDSMDFGNIVALGPGVVDATCTLHSWTKLGLYPSAQLVLDGEVEVDADCRPVEFNTQDVSFTAIGQKESESIFTDKIEKLKAWTEDDQGMSAYFLGLLKVPSLAAFTDLCTISHNIRPVRHLAETKVCSDTDEKELKDAQTMTRVITSNILLHHFWHQPLATPVNSFPPKDYASYLYRAIGKGLTKDAAGQLSKDSSKVNPRPIPSGVYHLPKPTALAVLPLILVGVLYFTFGIGLCISDCRNVKGICFDGLISHSFREVFSRRHSRHSSRNSSRQITDYLHRMRSPSRTPDTQVEYSSCSPKTVITYSTCDFLTGDKRSPSPQETPRSERAGYRSNSVELIRVNLGNTDPYTEPLVQSCGPRKPKAVGNTRDCLLSANSKIKTQEREQKISSQEIYEALGSGTDSEGEKNRPITNSELNKLLKV